ncbi:Hint domain-containing protein [Pseudophaeobacter leonis]|uniref:Hint domain-containing protein n=1 Tax=Pseudophaeobacter leonis TaxID=1144477 RepID=UPI001F4EDD3F|nr:Hint domain-containing protein [Pseudophaeobacter leonis]
MLDWFQKRMNPEFDLTIPPVSVGEGGLLAGTHVASNLGWRPVEALCAGDKVLTFDHGMQTIVEVCARP